MSEPAYFSVEAARPASKARALVSTELFRLFSDTELFALGIYSLSLLTSFARDDAPIAPRLYHGAPNAERTIHATEISSMPRHESGANRRGLSTGFFTFLGG